MIHEPRWLQMRGTGHAAVVDGDAGMIYESSREIMVEIRKEG